MITCRVLASSMIAIPLPFLLGMHLQKLLFLYSIGFEYRRVFVGIWMSKHRCLCAWWVSKLLLLLICLFPKFLVFGRRLEVERDMILFSNSWSRRKKKWTHISKMRVSHFVCHDLSGMVFPLYMCIKLSIYVFFSQPQKKK